MSARLGACAAVLVGILAAAGQARAYGPAGVIDCAGSLSGGAVVYYVCDCQTGASGLCTAGNDANAGTSAASPWQTFEKGRAKFSSLNPGDRIEYCDGGSFAETNNGWQNSSSLAGNAVVVTDYAPPWGNGSEGLPIVAAGAQTFGDFEQGGTPVTDIGNYVFQHLDIRGSGSSSVNGAGQGFFFFNRVSTVSICSNIIQFFNIGVQTAGGNTKTDHNPTISVKSNYINNNGGQGMLGCDNNWVIDKNQLYNNGFDRALLNHNMYLSSSDEVDPGTPVGPVTVTGNDLHQNAVIGGACGSTSLVGHGIINNLTIKGNRIWEDPGVANNGCYGIQISPGDPFTESYDHLVIDGNLVQNMGGDLIGTSSCTNCTIQNNLLLSSGTAVDHGINVPVVPDEVATVNLVITGNTFYLAQVSTGVIGIDTGTNNIYANNAIHGFGSSGTFTCFQLPLSSSAYSFGNNNDCYAPGYGTFHWANTSTLAAWNGATGLDSASFSTNPLFVSPGTTTFDFHPGAGSPLINAGNFANASTLDFNGVTRGNPPEIGAFEVVTVPQRDFGGANCPIMYGVWLCLVLVMLGSAGIAIHKAVKQKKSESLYLSDEFVVLALEEMRDDGIGFTDDELRREAVPRERKWRR